MISPKLPLLSLLVAFTLAVLPDPARGVEYVSLETTGNRVTEEYNAVAVAPTDLVTFVGGCTSTGQYVYGTSASSGAELQLARYGQIVSRHNFGAAYQSPLGLTWTGLTEVKLKISPFPTNDFITIRITKPGELLLSNPLVLPTNPSSLYKIAMETSNDQVNWSPAAPGVIPADSPLGYWRIVAEEIVENKE